MTITWTGPVQSKVASSSPQRFFVYCFPLLCFSDLTFQLLLIFWHTKERTKNTSYCCPARNTGSSDRASIRLLMTHLRSVIITDDNRITRNCFICHFKWALSLHTWILNGSSLLRRQTPNTIIALWNSSAACSRQRSRNLQSFGRAALKVL